MEEKEYTLSEAAERLAELKGKEKPYSRQYVHKLCKEGFLHYRKIGQRSSVIVITEADLLEFVLTKRKVGRPKKIS